LGSEVNQKIIGTREDQNLTSLKASMRRRKRQIRIGGVKPKGCWLLNLEGLSQTEE